MSLTIAAEHFRLTEPIREQIIKSFQRVNEIAPKEVSIRVFLSRVASGSFGILVKARLGQHEFVCRESGPDLYAAISAVGSQLKRRVIEGRKKMIHSRRKMARFSPFVLTAMPEWLGLHEDTLRE